MQAIAIDIQGLTKYYREFRALNHISLQVKEGEFFLPYSDVEKTLIDMVYFKERIGALSNFKKRIDRKKLERYLGKYPIKFRKRVFGILSEKS